jgi:hypothetical protein
MQKAVEELRCVEWSNITLELMMNNKGLGKLRIPPADLSALLFSLSRPVRQGGARRLFHVAFLARQRENKVCRT